MMIPITRKIFFTLLLSAGMVLCASGCVNVGLKKAFPDIKTYSLDTSSQKHSAYQGTPVSISVNSFSSDPVFGDRYLTYRTGDTNYEQDFYNQLMVSPAAMTRDQVAIWLKGSPLVAFVLKDGPLSSPGYVVDGKLLELCGDYRSESSPKAVLRLQLTVSNVQPGNAATVFQKIYSAEIPMASISPQVLTEGWNAGLGQILAGFEIDFAAVLSQSRQN